MNPYKWLIFIPETFRNISDDVIHRFLLSSYCFDFFKSRSKIKVSLRFSEKKYQRAILLAKAEYLVRNMVNVPKKDFLCFTKNKLFALARAARAALKIADVHPVRVRGLVLAVREIPPHRVLPRNARACPGTLTV